jgi:salicylate hydroxylase
VQAIEDAAVFSVVVARMPDRDPHSINKALRIHERPCKQRAETLVDLAAANGRELYLGEGAAKEERDKQFAALRQGKGPVPDKWADANVQGMIYAHDCMQIAQVSFDKLFQSI